MIGLPDIVRQTCFAAFVGLQFGMVELARLRAGHYDPRVSDLARLLLVHALLGAAIGATAYFGLRVLGRLTGRPPAARLVAVLPSFLTLFAMGGIVVNVLYLPARLSVPSLLADLGLLLGVLGIAFLWSRRPFSRRTDRALAGVLVTLNLVIVLWPAGDARSGATVRREAERGDRTPPNIVIVLLDTLRADHLGVYGYARPTSPRIDELAGRGIVFDHAYSTSNWTRPSVASLLTSTMPSRHGAIEVNRRIAATTPLLAEALSVRGYAVGFFTVGVNVEPSDGYARGVDEFFTLHSRSVVDTTLFMRHVILPLARATMGSGGTPGTAHGSQPVMLTDAATRWAETVPARRPLALYVHYHGPHSPYAPPREIALELNGREPDPRFEEHPENWAGENALVPEDRDRIVAQYDAEVLWHDRSVGALLDRLQALGRLDNAVVIVTADHGEGFGEHGNWAHGVGMWNETVRIPMILWASDPALAAGRIATPVSLLDLAPTITDFADAPTPASFDGGSLRPLLTSGEEPERFVVIENPKHDELGLRTAEWAYFEGATPAGHMQWLYRADDLRQERDLGAEHPDLLATFHELLVARREADRERADESEVMELDEDRVEQLKALGYLQ